LRRHLGFGCQTFFIFPLDSFTFALYYIIKGGTKGMLYQTKMNIMNRSQSVYMSKHAVTPPPHTHFNFTNEAKRVSVRGASGPSN
jgi:hypothetical protein